MLKFKEKEVAPEILRKVEGKIKNRYAIRHKEKILIVELGNEYIDVHYTIFKFYIYLKIFL